MDMIKYMKQIPMSEKAKMTTVLLGDRRATKSKWLLDIINVKRSLEGKEPVSKLNGWSDHLSIKSKAADMLVAMIEGEKA